MPLLPLLALAMGIAVGVATAGADRGGIGVPGFTLALSDWIGTAMPVAPFTLILLFNLLP